MGQTSVAAEATAASLSGNVSQPSSADGGDSLTKIYTYIIIGVGSGLIVITLVIAVILCIVRWRRRRRRSRAVITDAAKTTRAASRAAPAPGTVLGAAAGQGGNNYEAAPRQSFRKTAAHVPPLPHVAAAKAPAAAAHAALAIGGSDRRFIELPTTTQPCPVASGDDPHVIPKSPAARMLRGPPHVDRQVTMAGSYPKVALRPPKEALASAAVYRGTEVPASSGQQSPLLPPGRSKWPGSRAGDCDLPLTLAAEPGASTVAAPLVIDCDAGDERDDEHDDGDEDNNYDYYDDEDIAGAVRGYVDMSMSAATLLRGPCHQPPSGAAAVAHRSAGGPTQSSRLTSGCSSPASPAADASDSSGEPRRTLGGGDFADAENYALAADAAEAATAAAAEQQGSQGSASDDDRVSYGCDVEGSESAPWLRPGSHDEEEACRSSGSAPYENEIMPTAGPAGGSGDGSACCSSGDEHEDYYNAVETAAYLYVNLRR